MKIIGIIPARYNSTRFNGKPLADICGKPMIRWVYEQVIKCKKIDEVYVATDDERIKEYCNQNNINVLMTSKSHKTPTDRVYEVSTIIDGDLYVSVNGDEPLIDPETIEQVIPKKISTDIFISNIITTIKDPVEVVDFTNLKVVTNDNGKGIYISRSPIPYPKGNMDYQYKKHIGVYAFNKKALDFYHNTKRGKLEEIEDIDLLRFIENDVDIKFVDVKCDSLSVDTPKDLEKIVKIINNYL